MKLLTAFYENNEIAIRNSFWGVESVWYNGEKMTSEFSWGGAKHSFTVEENGELVDYFVKVGFAMWGVSANIYRNNEPIFLGLKSCSRGRRYAHHHDHPEFV